MNNTIDFKRLQKIINEEIRRHMKLHEGGVENGPGESQVKIFNDFMNLVTPLYAAIEKFEKECPDAYKGKLLMVGRLREEIEKVVFPIGHDSMPKNQVNAVPDLRTPNQGQK